ncbi:hypothetical protein BKA70DRAFT_1294272 [Coprinopsis sp. MPI-PUGE-AT-0042]|nr:hypothetical protein BKA70DRAFT_1294272 [Coprinopsis sp. MPI-PUGE-AT-0042]
MKIPPVRSIDVQPCEILFMRHMHWLIVPSLSSPYLHQHFPSPRLLNIPPGTRQSLSPLSHRRELKSVIREVNTLRYHWRTTWLPRPSGPLPPSLVYLARLVHLVSGFAPDLVPHVELRFSMPTTDVLLNPSRNEDSRNPSTKSTYPLPIQLLLGSRHS